MGVHGLWRLIEPSGKTVPLETLENKVLAVDVSIWLHQAIKGFQDAKGGSVPNSHLLGIYHRVCKLLYFKIKPVFVFDGGVPVLKKQTIAKRNQNKARNLSEANKIQKQLLSTLLKHSAVNKVLSEKTKACISSSSVKKIQTKDEEDNLYYLPPTELDSTISSSESEEEYTREESGRHINIHNVDTESKDFKALPADVRHDILSDLKETRKQSSWGRLHEMPTISDDFSTYQMKRLLKRQTVQLELEKAEKEMGGHSLSLGELENLLTDQGVIMKSENIVGRRIAADENTRYLYIKDVKAAIEEAKLNQEKNINEPSTSTGGTVEVVVEKEKMNKADLEYEEDLERAIQLSLECCDGKNNVKDDWKELSYESSEIGSDVESDSEINTLSSAQNYMLEYSGLTPAEISKILNKNKGTKIKSKGKNKLETGLFKKSLQNKFKNKNKIHAKPSNNTENLATITETISDSDTEDFLEVSEISKAEPEKTDILSDSEAEQDFIEIPEKAPNNLEIVVKPDETLEDDLFSDIFTKENDLKIPTTVLKEIKEPNNSVEIHKETLEVKPDKLEDELINILGEETSTISIKEVTPSQNLQKEVDTEKLLNFLTDQPVSNNDNIFVKDSETSVDELKSNKIVEASTLNNFSTNKLLDLPETSTTNKEQIVKQVAPPKLSVEEVEAIKEKLIEDKNKFEVEISTKRRMAENITDQITKEAQELLELFGVPYITAPMEAEAQCAFLDEINLTDGTITDDSDIWLFGGKTVYKNFFNHTKQVLEFKAENIKHHFKLTREQLILLALLVGSDYTNGIQGVGPVTALEILAAFPLSTTEKAFEYNLTENELISGLSEFKKWFSCESIAGPKKNGLRTKLNNVTFSEGFPNIQVIQAYLKPMVETSREEFSWAQPDLIGLKEYARQKFGWTSKKSEEILNPVVKRLAENKTQKSIKDYFKTKSKIVSNSSVEEKMSKRVKMAVKCLDGTNANEETENEKAKAKKERKPRKKKGEAIIDEATEKKKTRGRTKSSNNKDEEIEALANTKAFSKKRVQEIDAEINEALVENNEVKPVVKKLPDLHKKEFIPQREKNAKDMVKQKLKAIEIFRKSQKGPGFVKSKKKPITLPKDDAELSESSSDEN